MDAKKAKEVTHVSDLKYDKKNARIHSAKGIGMIADGLQEVGFGRSVLIDKDNNILAGNGTIEAAAQVGITKVRVIETDGTEVIAVKRINLTKKQAERLKVIDNRAGEMSSWNTETLKEMLHEDEDSLKGLWAEEELDFLLQKPTDFTDDPLSPESAASRVEPSIERVILWIPVSKNTEFQLKVRELGERYGLVDITEIVMEAITREHEGK